MLLVTYTENLLSEKGMHDERSFFFFLPVRDCMLYFLLVDGYHVITQRGFI